MNEPSSVRRPFVLVLCGSHPWAEQFCVYPCDDPAAQAVLNGVPPNRTESPPDPNAPILGSGNARRGTGDNLLTPPYAINNTAGPLSSRTAYVSITIPARQYRPRMLNCF
jgi:hypothetical protein